MIMTGSRFWLIVLSLGSLLLAGCANTLRSNVTSFQRWPADTVSSANTINAIYSFKRLPGQQNSLEHGSYEDLVRAELNRLGMKEAAAGSKGRFEVSLDYGVNTRIEKRSEPVWDDRPFGYSQWRPAYHHPGIGWRPGYWVHEPFGYAPRVVGYQTVSRDVNTRRLRVDISEGAAKVFEASATSEGGSRQLSNVMPYLVRSAFDGFPGTNGQARVLEFDVEKGQITKRGVMQPR
jgi:hypothetical protein